MGSGAAAKTPATATTAISPASAPPKADAVLLLGHGSGESAMGQVLLHYLENHHRELLNRIVGIESPNDDGLSDGEILALDRPRGTSDLKAGSSLPSS